MRLRIHRGAREIGGSCVELEQDGRALLLDLGLPLESAPTLPHVGGLAREDGRLLGVVLSHPHLDHYGLLASVRLDLPVWLGAGAKRLLEAAAPFAPASAIPQAITPYRTREPFEVGRFRITPYLMDHSAYNAHALLVEASGKRLFYTGDFRGHGRKAATFEHFLAHPPAGIDVLLMEGTTIGRDDPPATEKDVEDRASTLMCDTPGLVLACFSGQNIDRLVSFLRASIRAGRALVLDAYTACLVDALALSSLPDPRTDTRLCVFLPRSQRRRIIASKQFDLIDRFAARRIYPEEIDTAGSKLTLVFRASMIPDIEGVDLIGASLLYSLWPGYLERDQVDLRGWCGERGIAFHLVHSSGHASVEDLRRMATAIRPRRLLPIHTALPDLYPNLFANVIPVSDGEWVEV